MNRLDYYLLDNPVLTMLIRSRTRIGRLIPWIVIVLTLGLIMIWASEVLPWPGSDGATVGFVAFQTLIVFYLGTYRIATTIGGARQTGILDFHRIAPLSPAATTLGFFLGAPAAEYFLAALVLPLAFFCAWRGDLGVFGLLQLELALLPAAWAFHAFGMLSALASRKPKARSNSGVAGIVLLFLFTGQAVTFGLYSGARGVSEGTIVGLSFYSLKVHWLIFEAINLLPMLGFLFLGCTRLMHWERAHAYTKRSALAFMATTAFLLIGDFWNFRHLPFRGIALAAIYPLLSLGVILAICVTPDRAEYLRGLLRAKKQGRRRPGPFEDAALNRVATYGLCVLFFAATTIVVAIVRPSSPGADQALSLAIACGVSTLAAFSFCYQFFLLRAGRSGAMLTVLTLFSLWVVPVLAGGVLQLASSANPATTNLGRILIAVCPIAGIAIVGADEMRNSQNVVALAAIASPLTLAFAFHYLLSVAQRKAELITRPQKPKSVVDELQALDEAPARI